MWTLLWKKLCFSLTDPSHSIWVDDPSHHHCKLHRPRSGTTFAWWRQDATVWTPGESHWCMCKVCAQSCTWACLNSDYWSPLMIKSSPGLLNNRILFKIFVFSVKSSLILLQVMCVRLPSCWPRPKLSINWKTEILSCQQMLLISYFQDKTFSSASSPRKTVICLDHFSDSCLLLNPKFSVCSKSSKQNGAS